MPVSYNIRECRPGEASYVADLHRRLYTEEYGWGPEFVSYAQKIALDFENHPKHEREALWVVEVFHDDGMKNSELAGCIMLCETEEKEVGQLRLFAVEKAYRRHGLGRKLVETLLDRARQLGFSKIILWTAAPLEAALRQYERFGFKVTETQDNTSWSLEGKTVTEIKMELTL